MSVSANQMERDMGTAMADDTLIEISVGGQVSLKPVIRLWSGGPAQRPSEACQWTAGSICWETGWTIRGLSSRILLGSYWRRTAPFERIALLLRVDGRWALHGSLARVGTGPGDWLSECRRLVASPACGGELGAKDT